MKIDNGAVALTAKRMLTDAMALARMRARDAAEVELALGPNPTLGNEADDTSLSDIREFDQLTDAVREHRSDEIALAGTVDGIRAFDNAARQAHERRHECDAGDAPGPARSGVVALSAGQASTLDSETARLVQRLDDLLFGVNKLCHLQIFKPTRFLGKPSQPGRTFGATIWNRSSFP